MNHADKQAHSDLEQWAQEQKTRRAWGNTQPQEADKPKQPEHSNKGFYLGATIAILALLGFAAGLFYQAASMPSTYSTYGVVK